MDAAPATPPRRQIVVCCDGTNNTLTGGSNDTNVVLLHNHLAAQPMLAGVERILYYDPGVGSPGTLPPVGPVDWAVRKWERVSGLASGGGVFDNIAQAYIFLMRNWRDNGDHIYLFGFSRGAFTVRALAGMVNLFGVVRPEYEALVPTLVHIYFSQSDKSRGGTVQKLTRWAFKKASKKDSAAADPTGHPDLKPADARPGQPPGPLPRSKDAQPTDDRDRMALEVRANYAGAGRQDAWVHWIGVWDTVESVGLPGPFSRVNPSPPVVLGKRYRNVRHALSLDEHRWPFLPRLYEEPGDLVAADNPDRQTLKQRWYPGVHCDAGGSYDAKECGVSDAALHWMVDEVKADMGIASMQPAASTQVKKWRHDPLWDTPLWALGGMTVRPMRQRIALPERAPFEFQPIPTETLPAGPIHSVWEKRRGLMPLVIALLVGLLALVAYGVCLLLPSEVNFWPLADAPATALHAMRAAQHFAGEQLTALWGGGLMAPGHRPWELNAAIQPGWAMLWDLVFIACWGYLLSRIASRAFAWLAGFRDVNSPLPAWRWLGFAPMLAVSADVAEDSALWAALALHGAGTDTLAAAALWLGGAASALKFASLAVCMVLVVVRVIVVFSAWPRERP